MDAVSTPMAEPKGSGQSVPTIPTVEEFKAAKSATARLTEIGREIRARVEKLNQIGGKAVDQFDSINCLLKEAEGLCDAGGFAKFKHAHCLELGQSRAYELLAVQQGRKTVDEIREATRLRVAKHRTRKNADVTEKDSVTLNGQPVDLDRLGPAAKAQIATSRTVTVRIIEHEPEARTIEPEPEASAEKRKAEYAEADDRDDAESDQPLPWPVDNDPLVVKNEDGGFEETVYFTSLIKPIFEGGKKNEIGDSALALRRFKTVCATLLPEMNVGDLQTAKCILYAVGWIEDEVRSAVNAAKAAVAKAKRLKWETKNPEKAKLKARDEAQDDAMKVDMDVAKEDNRGSGEPWSELKDEWIQEWIASNWGAEEEAEFEAIFKEKWIDDHGTAFPEPLGRAA